MNIHVYCTSVSASPIEGDVIQLYLKGVDKEHLKVHITEFFTLAEIAKLYEASFVAEVLSEYKTV